MLEKDYSKLEEMGDDELLEMFNEVEAGLMYRLALNRQETIVPIIPQEVKDFVFENRGYFEDTSIEVNDIDVGSVCMDKMSSDAVIYKAVVLDGENSFEWEVSPFKIKIWINSELVLESKHNYSLTFIDIKI